MNQSAQAHTINVDSPSNLLHLTLTLSDAGQLHYSIRRAQTLVLAPSTFALDVRPAGYLHTGFSLISQSLRDIDETYPIIAGKAASARNHCRQLTLTLQSSTSAQLTLLFRVYDDAVAFRYIAPAGDIVAERAEFHFPADHRCWPFELPHFHSSHESEFPRRKISDLKPGQLVGCPLTLQTADGLAIAITEAALHDFAGMYLEAKPSHPTTLITRLAPRFDGSYACVRNQPTSPWRIIQVAACPAALIESNILYSLNDPCAIADTSWIKPGKVTWDWWSGHAPSGTVQQPGMNTATMLDYIDFAADIGLEYFLLDGGWYGPSNRPDSNPLHACSQIDLPHLIKYAHQNGVDMLLWAHQADLRNRLDQAFSLYQSLGIKGVKVDFFDRDDQEMVQWARDVVLAAARHHLLVDLHGIFKPTGFERTYPNLMTHEGIMGAEYNKWSTRITPEHNVTIPFTRMLAGPMDYTPGSFANVTREQFKPRGVAPQSVGTRANNLAMYVVYQSALQMVSDYPDAIRGRRGSEFLKVVPSTWDETRAIAGSVGEFIVIARRKGDDWFLAAMTNSDKREIEIPLSFLPDARYDATIYEDGPGADRDPASLVIRNLPVHRSGTLTARLAPAGGLAAHLHPTNP